MSEEELSKVIAVEIARLSLRPGDVLVVRAENDVINYDTAQKIKQVAETALDHRNRVLVLDSRLSLTVLEREPDPPKEHHRWNKVVD